ncbi:MAG: redoxin family protein [Spirochaetaceae bacterium]|nr:redoxin family protein [Spirochaetaceae bacterium]MDE0447929.1 redoxin family protein [Spirochaetaceae bacterium]
MRSTVARLLIPVLLLGLAATASATDEESAEPEPAVAWLATELTDVASGETFTLAEFAGTPVLLESFAVWCPICTNQQKQVRALHEEVGDEVVSIALNTDPNEDRDKVAAHIARHGFDWRYAVAPVELILALKEEFGVGFLNAPSAPMVLICPDQNVREMLKRGVKRANFLQEQVAACAAPAT